MTVAGTVIFAVFAALRFNRQDSQAIVATQSTVLRDMKEINGELALATARIRAERDELLERILQCSHEVVALKEQVKALEDQIRDLRLELTKRSHK